MAHWPLDALEQWRLTLPRSLMEPIVETIIPYLEPYLQSVGQVHSKTLLVVYYFYAMNFFAAAKQLLLRFNPIKIIQQIPVE